MARALSCLFQLRLRSVKRTQRGAAAVEFAMVGPLFIFFICVAFDLGLLLFTQTVLNNAAASSARLIMTNQAGLTASTFATQLCNEMEGMIDCNGLQYYVQSAPTFSAMNAAVQTNSSGNLQSNGIFLPGLPGEDVVVQVAYSRPTLMPWAIVYMNGTAATISNNSNLLYATVVFQNEP
jgi:Flp pilus assembly protein TadG